MCADGLRRRRRLGLRLHVRGGGSGLPRRARGRRPRRRVQRRVDRLPDVPRGCAGTFIWRHVSYYNVVPRGYARARAAAVVSPSLHSGRRASRNWSVEPPPLPRARAARRPDETRGAPSPHPPRRPQRRPGPRAALVARALSSRAGPDSGDGTTAVLVRARARVACPSSSRVPPRQTATATRTCARRSRTRTATARRAGRRSRVPCRPRCRRPSRWKSRGACRSPRAPRAARRR